jgi:hypothetical protein
MPPQGSERPDETADTRAPEVTADRVRRTRSASSDELTILLHDPMEAILLALLENPNLEEQHVTQLLERADLSAAVLGTVAAKGKWMASEAVRLRLAQHPRTPKRVALAVVRQLFLFDLVRLSLLPSAPPDIRRIAEEIILARVPHLAVGEKLTLARRGPSRVAGAILGEGHPQATQLVLSNPFLTEAQVLKALAKPGVPERVVAAVAQHPKWSTQYNVRAALVRNAHTPPPSVLAFLPHLTLRDLNDIGSLRSLAAHTRKYIQQEVERREKKPGV